MQLIEKDYFAKTSSEMHKYGEVIEGYKSAKEDPDDLVERRKVVVLGKQLGKNGKKGELRLYFDPASPMSGSLKDVLVKMLQKEN